MEKRGAAALTLTADHPLTGLTTIAEGTLQLGDGGATGSVAGPILNDGELIFDRSAALTYAETISGTGSLTQAGSGTLTFTGTSTVLRRHDDRLGHPAIGDGGATGGIVGDAIVNGTLDFNRSDDVQFDGVLSGSGTLVKHGAGTLTLTAADPFAGSSTVAGGTLVQLGSIAGLLGVESGAALRGTGTMGSVTNEGLVAPGLSIGALSLAGDYTQATAGALEIEFNDRNEFDVLNVGGAATLAGNVDYLPDTSSLFAEDLVYTFLPAAGGVAGFATPSTREFAGSDVRDGVQPGERATPDHEQAHRPAGAGGQLRRVARLGRRASARR